MTIADVKAIIPVAGVGSRLRPHTHTTPKSLIHVAGKPILAHILDRPYVEAFAFAQDYGCVNAAGWSEESGAQGRRTSAQSSGLICYRRPGTCVPGLLASHRYLTRRLRVTAPPAATTRRYW